jgi:hypothetical protein
VGAASSQPIASQPRVVGPIVGGAHGWPFGASVADLTASGWVEEEYFVHGDATAYEPVGRLGADGRWQLRTREQMPFRTRILVRRPTDPADFRGTVLVSWSNVTAGFEILTGDGAHLRDAGIASVSVSAQAVGVHGFAGGDMGLVSWDPERYDTLSIPSDDISYDIFTRVARLVGPHRPRDDVDPLAGLPVERLIADGGSQSAMRLHSYINGVHPIARVFDGFFLLVQRGITMPFVTGGALPGSLNGLELSNAGDHVVDRRVAREAPFGNARIREDLDTPVFVVNSEGEVPTFLPIRPTGGRVHLWEIAGTAHGGGMLSELDAKFVRDFGMAFEGLGADGSAPDAEPNTVDWSGVAHAAVLHLDRWVATGERPPVVPLLEIGGEPPTIRRDEHGNARGGVRLPVVEVPIATVRGWGEGPHMVAVRGSTVPFPAEKLRALYPDHDGYVAQVEAAAGAAVAAGTLLPGAARRMVDDAERAPVPPPG